MQTISRYVYHDTISPFPLCVDIFITAILIYDITDFIFIFTVQLQVFMCTLLRFIVYRNPYEHLYIFE